MEITEEQAIKLYNTEWWKKATDSEIVVLQLFQERLVVPFDVFHKAIEEVLKRPVWTHEFAFVENLRKEFLGEKPKPSFNEIIKLIPKDKLIGIVIGD